MLDQTVRTSSTFTRNAFLATTAVGTAAMLLLWGAGTASGAVEPVPLGTADSFVVLAGQAVTATGANTLNGDLGIYPGKSLTGGSTITITGAEQIADAVALQAQSDLTTAYLNAAGQVPATNITADVGGGRTLTAGIYKANDTLNLTGSLTLNAEGNPDALFVFQADSDLIVGSGASVNLINDAQWCNVFWQVTSSATIGSGASFSGSILALSSITLADGATVEGRALARNGAVTLISNTFTTPACTTGSAVEASPSATPTPTPEAPSATPTPTPEAPSAGATVTPLGGIQTGDGSMAANPTGLDTRLAVGGSVGLLAAAAVVFAVLTRRRLRTV